MRAAFSLAWWLSAVPGTLFFLGLDLVRRLTFALAAAAALVFAPTGCVDERDSGSGTGEPGFRPRYPNTPPGSNGYPGDVPSDPDHPWDATTWP